MSRFTQYASRVLGLATAASFFLLPVSALAVACPASGCGPSQFCARDARIPEGSACYPTCDPDAVAGTASACTGGLICASVTGQGVCVPPESPLVTGGASANPRCDGTRTCPTDRTYECVSGECRIPHGQACTATSQCVSGSTCEGAGAGGTVCNPTPPSSSGGSTKADAPFKSITPSLGSPIPGVDLTPAQLVGDDVDVPFLAQYINGAYRYMVTIVLIVSIVMVVYGGFRYLVGASIGDIQAGKKIIQDALIGMLLVLGAYMLLNTINPATLNFTALRLVFVSRIDIESGLLATQADTLDPIDAASSGRIASPSYTDCPVDLSSPTTEPPNTTSLRRNEFKTEIASVLTGATSRERVLQVAEAASLCGVWLGSCGATAEQTYVLAGSEARGHQTHTVPQTYFPFMQASKCATYSRECTTNAASAVFDQISTGIPGWPNEWARELQPGDVITIYNANSDGYGLHRAIFMGWAGNGRANVIDGAYSRFVRSHETCITTDCANPWPLIRTFEPDP